MPLIGGHGLGRRKTVGPSQLRRFGMQRPETVTFVERRLDLPYQYRPRMDQGAEGSCVGWSLSWAMSIFNRHFYDAVRLYHEAQLVDPWPETPPEEGTSVEAGALVLKNEGHWRYVRGAFATVASLFEGVADFQHARTVDELRTAISRGQTFVLGIDWHENFDSPEWIDVSGLAGGKRWWIGRDLTKLGAIRGGHAICCFGARDTLQAFVLVNSWGLDYPIVNIPYKTVEALIQRDGAEAIVLVDR